MHSGKMMPRSVQKSRTRKNLKDGVRGDEVDDVEPAAAEGGPAEQPDGRRARGARCCIHKLASIPWSIQRMVAAILSKSRRSGGGALICPPTFPSTLVSLNVLNRLGCGRERVSTHVDSHLVAQVKAMLENPGQLEQELKVVREVAGLVELALQQARGEAGYRGCSPAQCVRLRFAGKGSWTFWSCRVCWMGFQS